MKKYKLYDDDGFYSNTESDDGTFDANEARNVINNTEPNGGYWIIKLVGFPFYILYLVFEGIIKILKN